MKSFKIPQKGIFSIPAHVKVSDSSCDFFCAMEIAKSIVKSRPCEPSLIGWYDNIHGERAPKKSCPKDRKECETVNEFESGDFSVEINDEDYIFVFRSYLGWRLSTRHLYFLLNTLFF